MKHNFINVQSKTVYDEFFISSMGLFFFQKSSELRSTSNFSGCMNEMYIDDQKIGLHNFKTTSKQGCWGCRNVSVIFFYWVSRHNLSLSELKEFLGVVACMSLSLFLHQACSQCGTDWHLPLRWVGVFSQTSGQILQKHNILRQDGVQDVLERRHLAVHWKQ